MSTFGGEGRRDIAQHVRPLLRRQGLLREWLREGRWPPLTSEPPGPWWGRCGQAGACPRDARRLAADCARVCRSGCWCCCRGWVRGGEETEDLPGDVALEDAHDFPGRSAFGSPSGQVVRVAWSWRIRTNTTVVSTRFSCRSPPLFSRYRWCCLRMRGWGWFRRARRRRLRSAPGRDGTRRAGSCRPRRGRLRAGSAVLVLLLQ